MSSFHGIAGKWNRKDWADYTWTSLEGTWSSKDVVVGSAHTQGQGIQVLWSGGLTAHSLGLKAEGPTGVSNPKNAVREFSDIFEQGDEIGRGSFGVVRVGRHKVSGVHCVVKSVPREKVGDAYFDNHAKGSWRFLKFSRQAETHRNIIRYLDFLMAPAMMYIVMEELKGHELFTYLQEHAPVTETFCQCTMRQLLSALEHLHSLGIIHRDVKVEALRFRDPSPRADLVLFDFGHCCSAEDMDRGIIGTVSYMAPEAFGHDYSSQVDLWAAGVVLYIMLTGCLPFRRDHTAARAPPRHDALCAALVRQELRGAPLGAVGLLQGLLKFHQTARLSAADALRLPWLQVLEELSATSASLGVTREAYQATQQEIVQSSFVEQLPPDMSAADFARSHWPYFGPSTEALREEFAASAHLAEGLRPYSMRLSTEALREELEMGKASGQVPAWGLPPPGLGMMQAAPAPLLPANVPPEEPHSCKSSGAASPYSNTLTSQYTYTYTFTVSKKKLQSREPTVVSSVFAVPMGDAFVNFKVVVAAKHLNNRRGGCCFRTAKGKALLQLKCEGTPPMHASRIKFSFRLGSGVQSEAPRDPVVHDFSQTMVGRLPQDQEEWDLLAAMDPETEACTIYVETISLNDQE